MDYTALTSAVDFAGALTSISTIAAAMMVPLVGIVGWKFVRRVVR